MLNKKICVFLIGAMLAFSLTACGGCGTGEGDMNDMVSSESDYTTDTSSTDSGNDTLMGQDGLPGDDTLTEQNTLPGDDTLLNDDSADDNVTHDDDFNNSVTEGDENLSSDESNDTLGDEIMDGVDNVKEGAQDVIEGAKNGIRNMTNGLTR